MLIAAELWDYRDGTQLLEAYRNDHNLSSELPSSAGVYLWKVNLTSGVSFASQQLLANHTLELMRANFGATPFLEASHYIQIPEVKLRGRGLPPEKVQYLNSMLEDKENRKSFLKFLNNLTLHQPTLYVGDAKNLAERVAAHVTKNSQFHDRLTEHTRFSISDLRLYFVETPDLSENERKTIESIVTTLTGAWLVRRQG